MIRRDPPSRELIERRQAANELLSKHGYQLGLGRRSQVQLKSETPARLLKAERERRAALLRELRVPGAVALGLTIATAPFWMRSKGVRSLLSRFGKGARKSGVEFLKKERNKNIKQTAEQTYEAGSLGRKKLIRDLIVAAPIAAFVPAALLREAAHVNRRKNMPPLGTPAYKRHRHRILKAEIARTPQEARHIQATMIGRPYGAPRPSNRVKHIRARR